MATLDNTTKKAVATDVGFKISKPGFDARRTAGNNLVFSSSWPGLQVLFEKVINNPINGPGLSSTLGHNLKFPPLTFVWAYGPDPSGIANSSRRIAGMASVDSNTVYLSDNGLSGIETDFLYSASKLIVRCFQIDLSKDVDYILAPGDTFKYPYDSNFGVKVAKQNKNINSTDLRDFALHSRAQSPLVLAVKTQDTANPANPQTVQYTNKFSYPVWVYGYVKSTAGLFKFADLGGQSYPITRTDGFVSSLTYNPSSGDNGATLVILRDPMFSATQTTAQY